MTNSEAISIFKAILQCTILDSSGMADDCDRHCEYCELEYAKGTVEEQKQVFRMAIKALEKEVD